jgi:1-acyl-sn-glycerol-3-phosphate acyltransferase
LLYHLIKPVIRLALLLFCRRVYMNHRRHLNVRGPLILAVNHPNSFLDAVVVGAFFKQPVHFLARGDAFRKKWALRILQSLKCIPVYRLREGREYLHLNDATFERCRDIFKKGGIVLIFSEGLSINEFNLRPLRKGTARLACSAWNDAAIGDALRILPVGVSYDSFHRHPKELYLNYGEFVTRHDVEGLATDGAVHAHINQLLTTQLELLTLTGIPDQPKAEALYSFAITNAPQVSSNPFEVLKKLPSVLLQPENAALLNACGAQRQAHCAVNEKQARQSLFWALLTALPAFAALFAGYWFYRVVKSRVIRSNVEQGHYDSMMYGLLALVYPFWALILAVAAGWWTGHFWLIPVLLVAQPLLALCLTVFVRHWRRFYNFNKLDTVQRVSLQQFFNQYLK